MKKKMTLVLSIVMVLALFCGCGGGAEKEAAAKAELEATRALAVANVNPPDEFPFVKEPITLKIMVGQRTEVEDMVTNEFTKKMEDWGINIEWNTIPSANVDEKVNLILSTGESLPDIFMNCNIRMPQQIEFGNAGYFIDMAPYFDEYAPNVLKMFEQSPVTKATVETAAGNIYSMGSYAETYHTQYPVKMWMNTTWLDALNLELPTTIDGFYDTLVAFKNNDPNGNGKADEIPLSGSIKGWKQRIVPFLMSSFIDYRQVQGVHEGVAFRIVGNKIDFSFDEPEWKEGLIWLNKLYEEGLIDPQSLTQDTQQLKSTVNNKDNLVGAVPSGAPGGFTTGDAVRDKYTTVKPLVGPSGQQYTDWGGPIDTKTGHFVITNECENIEAAIRFLDYLMSEEGSLTSSIGQQGRDWTYIDDPSLLGINGEPAVYQRILKFHKQQNASWTKQGPQYFPDALRNGMLAEEGDIEPRLYIETEENYAPFGDGQYLLPFVITADYNKEYIDIMTPMQEYLDEFTAQAITGIVDIEKEWDKYLEILESMNYERLLEIINESYTTLYGKIDLWND